MFPQFVFSIGGFPCSSRYIAVWQPRSLFHFPMILSPEIWKLTLRRSPLWSGAGFHSVVIFNFDFGQRHMAARGWWPWCFLIQVESITLPFFWLPTLHLCGLSVAFFPIVKLSYTVVVVSLIHFIVGPIWWATYIVWISLLLGSMLSFTIFIYLFIYSI